ncbi:hypothetical protein PPL_08205 [Heterostelium album PN500]|uniref:Ankyrin repeat-containing protein n=1 Tax=Heterostelium pallidum (strain ATCC 26659 / Pp 5 / PN500) TaxID=670386 RepID=D3BIX0_HETP5|nr:hypothetical protein PPL_08205 [Heterostelium album PN500]EFA78744.1 hypothetical protein PPL_08205 [Heterostelium album PN500]|eukprot:XP_020430868.1 hypothetical protein PPL_08205 [Heterostelium album PN500]
MDRNSDRDRIFKSVFANKLLLNNIYNQVHFIYVKKKVRTIPWNEVLHSPMTLMSYGYLRELKHLLDSTEMFCSFATVDRFFSAGRLDIVEYLYPMITEIPSSSVKDEIGQCAAKCEHSSKALDIVKFLHKHEYINSIAKLVESFSLKKNFEVANYFYSVERVILSLTVTPTTIDMFAKHGEFELLKKLRYSGLDNSVDYAASGGHLEIVKYLTENKRGGCTKPMDLAAQRGHLHVVRYLHEHRSEGCTTLAMDDAAKGNHWEVVQFLHENRTEGCSVGAIRKSAKYGHFSMVKWLSENRSEGFTGKAINQAALNGHFEIAVYLYDLHPEKSWNAVSALISAAKGGHIEIVRYFFSKATNFNQSIKQVLTFNNQEINQLLFREHSDIQFTFTRGQIENFIQLGNLDAIKIIHERLPQAFNGHSIILAIEYKHLDILQFLYENCRYIEYYQSTLTKAIMTNKIDIVRYVLSMEIDVIQNITNAHSIKELHEVIAARLKYSQSHVGIFQLLVDKYPQQLNTYKFVGFCEMELVIPIHRMGLKVLNKNTMYRAIGSGRLDLVKYIYDNRSEYTNVNYIDVSGALEQAIFHFPIFLYLYPKCPSSYNFQSALIRAAEKGSLQVVKYFHENHPDDIFSTKIMDVCAGSGSFEVLKFLHFNRTEGCSSAAIDNAAVHGKLEILQFLHANRTEGYTMKAIKCHSSLCRDWIQKNLKLI